MTLETHVLVGHPADQILKAAARYGANMIVVGHRGEIGHSRLGVRIDVAEGLHSRDVPSLGREGPLMAKLMPYLLVGLGGFIGANTRFVVARLVGALFETQFPLGTFVINVSGSFLSGSLAPSWRRR